MKNINNKTIIRTIVLIIALVNQILVSSGKNPLPWSDDQIYESISILLTVSTSLWSWWKNNSFTQNAIKCDEMLKELKAKGEK